MKKCVVCLETLYGLQQKYCSAKCKQKDHYNKVKSQPNTYHSQTIRGLNRKMYFINLLGGKCKKCGYNKNLSVFNFHHKDPDKKELNLDIRSMGNNSFEKLEKEVKKCSLLCSNCHLELHNPELDILNVNDILEGNDIKIKLKKKLKNKNYCKCGKEILPNSNKCRDCEMLSRIKKNKPTIKQLKKDLKTNTLTTISEKYNVSRTTIKRWLNQDL